MKHNQVVANIHYKKWWQRCAPLSCAAWVCRVFRCVSVVCTVAFSLKFRAFQESTKREGEAAVRRETRVVAWVSRRTKKGVSSPETTKKLKKRTTPTVNTRDWKDGG